MFFLFLFLRLLVVSNPTEQARASMVTVYVNTANVRVLNALGHVVHAQVSAVWNDATHAAADVFQVRSAASMHHSIRGVLYGKIMSMSVSLRSSTCSSSHFMVSLKCVCLLLGSCLSWLTLLLWV